MACRDPPASLLGKAPFGCSRKSGRKHLNDAGITHVVHQFGGECSYPEIERIKETARTNKAQVIIGAGGGKVLDAARAAADDLDLSVVNCPSIASSDAPCSALSVIYTPEGVFQEYRFYRKNPDLVVVDTSVVAQAPGQAAGGRDGRCAGHVVRGQNLRCRSCPEYAWGSLNAQRRKAGLSCATTSWLKTVRTRKRAVERHVVQPSPGAAGRSQTPCCRGLGFESSGLAAAHAIHNGLTAAPLTHPYYHGEKVCLRPDGSIGA